MSKFVELVLDSWDYLLALLFQTACLGCRGVGEKALCANCRRFSLLPTNGTGVEAALDYTEPARSVLRAAKFQKRRELLRYFKPVVCSMDFSYVHSDSAIVPVPLHWTSFWQRGFNQSEILAKWVGEITGRRVVPDGLYRTHRTKPQSLIRSSHRGASLGDCFEWRRGHPVPERVLLVDDVLTSGGTVRACVAALNRAGISQIQVWTLLRASRAKPSKLLS